MPVSRCRKAKSAPTEKCLPSAANRIARASRSADSAAKASRISPSISGDDALPISARATTTAAMPPSWRSIRICAKSVTAPFLLLLLLAPDHRGRAGRQSHIERFGVERRLERPILGIVEVRLHVAIAHARSVSEAAGGLHRCVREHPTVEPSRVEALWPLLLRRTFHPPETELAHPDTANRTVPQQRQ